MIGSFSKIGKSWFAYTLFSLIILSFLMWGISDVFHRATQPSDVASIGSQKISYSELDQAYRQYTNQLRQQGTEVTPEMAREAQLGNSILKSMIERTLFSLTAHDLGLKIGNKSVVAKIQEQRMFQNEKGEFDRARFDALLRNNSIAEKEYTANLRQDIANNLLLATAQMNILTPQFLATEYQRAQNQRRSANALFLPYTAVNKMGAVDDADLQAYLNSKADNYRTPEFRAVTIAVINPTDLANTITISDDEIKAAYNDRIDELKLPEKRTIQFIMTDNETNAQKISELARGGQKLQDAANSVTGTTNTLKKLELVAPGTLPPELEKIVFALPRGETSVPVNAVGSWYVVQVNYIQAALVPELNTLKDKLRSELLAEKATDITAKQITALEDALASGSTLAELRDEFKLQLTTLPMVDKQGRDNKGAKIAHNDIDLITKHAFGNEAGQASAPLELKNGNSMIVMVDTIMPPRIPALAEIKARVQDDFDATQRATTTAERAAELQKAWQESSDIAALAQKYGARAQSINAIKRDDRTSISADVALALFNAKKVGDVVYGNSKDGIVVAKLTTIINDAAPADSKTPDAIMNAIKSQKMQDGFNQFVQALGTKHTVKTHPDAIDRLYQR